MKSLLTTVIVVVTMGLTATAQNAVAALQPLLVSYFEMKDALVNADAGTASAKAADFVKIIGSIDSKALPAAALQSFTALHDKLKQDAGNIAATKDISRQRDLFAGFSLDLAALAKAVKLSGQPVYQAYCPMKKMYWLTNEKIIKNPYYGKQMLNCGSIIQTFNP